MFSFTVVVWFVAVPVIARVAVQFVTSSSLEVVTHLTTNGGRDILYYHVGFGCCLVFLGIVSGFSFSRLAYGFPLTADCHEWCGFSVQWRW